MAQKVLIFSEKSRVKTQSNQKSSPLNPLDLVLQGNKNTHADLTDKPLTFQPTTRTLNILATQLSFCMSCVTTEYVLF